jgi:hypothetical protein
MTKAHPQGWGISRAAGGELHRSLRQAPAPAGIGGVLNQNLINFDQFCAMDAAYSICEQPAVTNLGGSYGKLRRFDAKAA